MKESSIFIKSYEMMVWLMGRTGKFPKEQRFLMAKRMENILLLVCMAAHLLLPRIAEAQGIISKPGESTGIHKATGDPTKSQPAQTVQDRIVSAAEKYLGKEYVFGGRDGQKRCRENGKRVACLHGIDCLSLLYFAYEDVFGTRWWTFPVVSSKLIEGEYFGKPVPGLNGVLRDKLDTGKLHKGDILFFMIEDYNLENDKPMLVEGRKKFGVWHTGIVHHVDNGRVVVIHAKPGAKVTIEPLDDISFEAVYVVRWDGEIDPG